MNSVSLCDELDRAIDRMQVGLAEPERSSQPETIELLKVAQDLASMPRADFISRLLIELEWQAAGRKIISASRALAGNPESSIGNFEFMPTLLGRGTGVYPFRGRNMAASAVLHAGLFLLLGSGLVLVSGTARMGTANISDATEVYLPADAVAPHGGGSGGATESTGASKGESPRFASEQFTPPTAVPAESKIKIDDTLIGPPDLNVPKIKQEGNPLSTLLALSNGIGLRGIGSGEGNGDGSGHGPGGGPGWDGGFGDNFFLPGHGVMAPRVLYRPEPDYSDEARQVKHQGIVTLSVVVGVDGRIKHVEVVHSLGMGLDEKAMEAVRTWRFEPGKKDGHPVPVLVTVDVDFRLY